MAELLHTMATGVGVVLNYQQGQQLFHLLLLVQYVQALQTKQLMYE